MGNFYLKCEKVAEHMFRATAKMFPKFPKFPTGALD